MNHDLDELFETYQQFGRQMLHQTTIPFKERTQTVLHYSILNFLTEKPEATMSQLAQFIGMSDSSASQVIDRLADQGLIVRRPDASDHRLVHLAIDHKGKHILAAFRRKMKARAKTLFHGIPPKDIKTLLRIQKTLLAKLRQKENAKLFSSLK